MKYSTLMTAVLLLLAWQPAGDCPASDGIPGIRLPGSANRETVCILPGVITSEKIPADSTEVANDCAAGTARLVRATWWGGYNEWHPGDPHVVCFDVRFYGDMECTPSSLIASYPSVFPDTTRIGYDPEGRPCFRYDLPVDVPVGPDAFWMSVQKSCELRYPPKWGRLGDGGVFDCPTKWRVEGGMWEEIPIYSWMDASHQFEVAEPTPLRPVTWGRIRTLYR